MGSLNVSPLVRTEIREKVMEITLDRPQKRNALTEDMYLALAAALEAGDAHGSVNVFFLQGSETCFTSGNDLNDFLERKDRTPGEKGPGARFLNVISTTRKPIVAAVGGPAVGIGTTMLLHCDLVYAGAGARFQVPFAALGLCPEGGSSLLLPLQVGYPRAAEMLMFGEPISADSALAVGLVNAVYPDGELLKNARNRAEMLAALPPASVQLTKHLLKRSRATAVRETIEEELRFFNERLKSKEFREAYDAFFGRHR
jgi:enoyl-CoA hydratase/carnithine racemase